MIRVGIAGGIGSGKSCIAKAFETLGYPVYYADNEAKRLMQSSEIIINSIKEAFGYEIYKGTELQKDKMAEIIFNDDQAREKINQIVHPEVRKDFELWAKQSGQSIVMMEAAILFDTGLYKELDATILVLADQEQRINRVLKRDGSNRKSVLNRINAQSDPEHHKKLATFLINNNDEDEIMPQILSIINKLNQNG